LTIARCIRTQIRRPTPAEIDSSTVRFGVAKSGTRALQRRVRNLELLRVKVDIFISLTI
jgi:hypothetical protein